MQTPHTLLWLLSWHCQNTEPREDSQRLSYQKGQQLLLLFSCCMCSGRKARGRGAEDATAEQFHRGELSPLSGKASARAVRGSCSPKTQTCCQNRNHMKHRKLLFDPSSCSRQDFGCLSRGVPKLLLCVPALYPLPVHLTLWLSSAAFVNSFSKQLKLFLL